MNLYFERSLTENYKESPQKIRVMSESWVANNIFCPVCGNPHIEKLDNNIPVADFRCGHCGEIFELKSKRGKIGRKIVDGAYETMIRRITSTTNPDLLLLTYSKDFDVVDLLVVPKFFFTPEIIERRNPLSSTARRAGWVGCNILYSSIPAQGKISIIQNRIINDMDLVVEEYARAKRLQVNAIEQRGWLLDVLNCVNTIPAKEFYLKEVYDFSDVLQKQHTENHNIEAKIRQQLQILRDKGFVEFLERGHYRKL